MRSFSRYDPFRGAVLAVLSGLLAVACNSPRARIERLAREGLLEREIVSGAPFRHVVYRPEISRAGEDLHVYIEGDGTPYIGRTHIATDPTSRVPIALELMLEDPAPTLYLGRPCYLGLAQDRGCDASYWTLKRFSPEVVQSLAAVLQFEFERSGARCITLIGHSGGAALAILIANRVPAVQRVVTVAGNLDVAGWTRLHGYMPLTGSLDPLTSTPKRSDRTLVHFAGSADSNIPASLINAAATQLGGRVIVIPGFDHRCCWIRLWPILLRRDFDPLPSDLLMSRNPI